MTETFTDRLKRHIRMSGPMPLAEFTHWAMADPEQGYYASREPIGRSGDFITAPEVSQMFGELIGVWTISAWAALGKPEHFNLVEIGPGRGTLMADLLRTAKSQPAFLDAASINLVETSENLIELQEKTLNEFNAIKWLKSVKELEPAPSIIFANELLDVLPIRQYVKSGDSWVERAVGLDDAEELHWVLTDSKLAPSELPEGHEKETDGAVFETSTIREAFMENTAGHLLDHDGVALFIDYGHLQSGFGDTFQAVKNHDYVSPLDAPGTADLTSHVDFAALAGKAKELGCHVYPPMTQSKFLLDLGLLERAGKLGQNGDEETREKITAAAERLAGPDQMGDLFKVLTFSRRELDLAPFSGD